jgi:hypothetical protein
MTSSYGGLAMTLRSAPRAKLVRVKNAAKVERLGGDGTRATAGMYP